MRRRCYTFFRGGQQHIIQYQPVAGRVRMPAKVGRRSAYHVPVVFRVVAAIKCPGAFFVVAMYVLSAMAVVLAV